MCIRDRVVTLVVGDQAAVEQLADLRDLLIGVGDQLVLLGRDDSVTCLLYTSAVCPTAHVGPNQVPVLLVLSSPVYHDLSLIHISSPSPSSLQACATAWSGSPR